MTTLRMDDGSADLPESPGPVPREDDLMAGHSERERAPHLPVGTVTFLLTDVAGSTRLWEADRDAMGRAIARHYEIIDEAVAKHGGARPVEQGEGDSTVSAFSRASDALRAALDIQRALGTEPWPASASIRVRIGIHTAEAQLRGDGNYVSAALNRCARLRSIGHGGQTLLSGATVELLRDELPADVSLIDLGEHALRDLARPEHVYQLGHPGLPSDFPALTSQRPGSSTLPAQLTSFIGREHQIEEVARLLEETRLLTLVGSGGCGKTRLAIEVAEATKDRYRDGVLWVDLSSLSDPALVPSTVASALQLPETLMQDPTDTVAAFLEHRNLLLLLDNCEHLAGACASFADRVLRACAEVAIFSTGREPFGVQGETAWRVPSLTLPSQESEDPEATESVRLFLERARRSRPQFRATKDTVAAIATICHRLDGIPLAIELAAARIRTMSPQQIAKGIGDRFSLLGGGVRTALPRQRTLEASVDWSYNLLSEPERTLFRRLAIFAGGFTLEAAERVCAGGQIDEFAVLDLLSQLVDRSLVQREEVDDETRYRVLETVRVYARQKLVDSGETTAIRDRHLACFVEFVERAEPEMEGPAAVERGERLLRDHDNVRAAIDWSVESRQTDSALRLCAGLLLFWVFGNHVPEGRRRVDVILALEGGDPGLRARALASAAGVAAALGDQPGGIREFAEQAVALARELGDARTLGRGLTWLGYARVYGDVEVAAGRELLTEATAAAERSGDAGFVSLAQTGLILIETVLGDWVRARDAAQRAVATARAISHQWQGLSLTWSGLRAVWWGEFPTARRCLDESISIGRATNNHFLITVGLCLLGFVEVRSGRYEEGRRDLDEAMAIARPGGLFFQVGVADLGSAERHYAVGELDEGTPFAQEAVAIFRIGNLPFAVAWGLSIQALIKEAQRDTEAARLLATEALEVARATGSPFPEGQALLAMARIHHAEGSIERAEETLHEALSVLTRSRLVLETVMALEHIAAIASVKESFEEGARLFGAAQAARDAIGYPLPPIRLEEHETSLGSLRGALGADAFDAAWRGGAALSLDEAVAYATRARGERKRPSHGWASLTPTELDVVRHLQQGLTNRQIGERLFISGRTVQTHLSHVFGKLGITSRVELVAEAARRGASEIEEQTTRHSSNSGGRNGRGG